MTVHSALVASIFVPLDTQLVAVLSAIEIILGNVTYSIAPTGTSFSVWKLKVYEVVVRIVVSAGVTVALVIDPAVAVIVTPVLAVSIAFPFASKLEYTKLSEVFVVDGLVTKFTVKSMKDPSLT